MDADVQEMGGLRWRGGVMLLRLRGEGGGVFLTTLGGVAVQVYFGLPRRRHSNQGGLLIRIHLLPTVASSLPSPAPLTN